MSKQTPVNTVTPDEQIAAARTALETLKRERDAYLKKQEATDPLRKFEDAIAAQQAELAAGEQAKQAEAVRVLAGELGRKVEAFIEEGDDLSSALVDAAESGANLRALLTDIHRLQRAINENLGRDEQSAPAFPTGKQMEVMVDIGFRSALQDSVFRRHVERLSSVDKREIGAITAGWGQRIKANWVEPFVGEEQQKNTEAA
jgi:hypothetical protein